MFHVKHEGWVRRVCGELGPDATDGQIEQLVRYAELLRTRGGALGVVAATDLDRIDERHVSDGLRGVACLPVRCRSVVDLGSGGGVPGIVFAIARPDMEVVLTEVRRNRVAFLELVADELRLANARVHWGRAEALEGRFGACTARAFASASATWGVARPLLEPEGVLLYWAGRSFDPDRDTPPDVHVQVQEADPLANGGPVVIMSAR
jgi:16S rRNA (guanine527-N7)-methyltransferase